MPPCMVGAAQPGKALMQVTASQVFLDNLINHPANEPILFFTMLIKARLEIRIVVVHPLPEARIGGLSGMADRGMGRH